MFLTTRVRTIVGERLASPANAYCVSKALAPSMVKEAVAAVTDPVTEAADVHAAIATPLPPSTRNTESPAMTARRVRCVRRLLGLMVESHRW